MHDFWYDYVWPRYDKKVKLCGMDKDSFIVYIKTDDIYKILERMLKLDLIL